MADAEELDILTPLTNDDIFSGIVTLTLRPKKGLGPRAYLYTEDENLRLVAEANRSLRKFKIAKYVTDFSAKGPEILGSCQRGRFSGLWAVHYGDEEPRVTAHYLRRLQKRSSKRVVTVTIKDPDGEDLVLTQEDLKARFQLLNLENGVSPIKDSKRNFYLTANGERVFSFAEIERDDEFALRIGAPLNIYEGFCLALTTLFLIDNEC